MGRPRTRPDTPAVVNHRTRTAATRAHKRPLFRAIIAEFLARPCTDCGVQYHPAAMQPDHVRGKTRKIAWFRDGNGSEELLRAELARCDVRCANCHAIRHAAGGTSDSL